MSRVRISLLGLLASGFLASNVPAQIYRWVDDKGTVHFTDERPRHQSGVTEVVEAGAQRTPMVRGGPDWRSDTPTPDLSGAAGSGDEDYYDGEYDEGPYYDVPRQGDTIIQVYERPPWFDASKPRRRGRDRRGDHGSKPGGDRERDAGRERGPHDRNREAGHPPVGSAPPSGAQAPAAQPPSRASSRALPRTAR